MSIRVLRTEKCKFFKENDKPGFNFIDFVSQF